MSLNSKQKSLCQLAATEPYPKETKEKVNSKNMAKALLGLIRDVTKLDGVWARSKFGPSMFEPEVFRKQMYCIKESTCVLVRTFRCHPKPFRAPRSDSAPGELCRHSPLLTPLSLIRLD